MSSNIIREMAIFDLQFEDRIFPTVELTVENCN